MRPHRDRERRDGQGRVDQTRVTEDRLAREHREDLRDDAEERQRQHIHLWVAEEPEQVLPQHDSARSGVEDVSAELAVDEQGDQRRREQREDQQDQQRGDEGVPGEDRHPEHGHAGGAQAHDGGDEVDRTEDRAETADGESEDPQVGTDAGRVQRVRQRHIRRPPEVGRASGGEEAGGGHEPAEDVEPEAHRIESGKGHVRSADLQRQQIVGEAEEHRGRVQQQHDRAVHGEQLVVLLVRQELQAGHGELTTDEQCHEAADEEPREGRHDVHHADDLVVGGGDDREDRRALRAAGRRIRPLRVRPPQYRRDINHDHDS
ncbi:hypothetical protein AIIKEEIJ_02828 [Rhodococcus sp. YH1]|nr:hypothetical protein [Rhodococcus sp. YH1]